VASDRAVRIVDAGMVPLHFLVADASGAVATIEFIDGRLVVHRGRDLPFPVLTNHTYERSAEYARRRDAGAYNLSSLDRFAQSARRVTACPARPGAAGVADAFTLLDDVAQGGQTQWSIVYAIGDRRVHFRTRLHRAVRSLDLDDLKFGCDQPAVCVAIHALYTGDLAPRLAPCTYDANLELVRAAFGQTDFLMNTPSAEQEQLARYPDSGKCER
jgi:choloylglycine hydrolase